MGTRKRGSPNVARCVASSHRIGIRITVAERRFRRQHAVAPTTRRARPPTTQSEDTTTSALRNHAAPLTPVGTSFLTSKGCRQLLSGAHGPTKVAQKRANLLGR